MPTVKHLDALLARVQKGSFFAIGRAGLDLYPEPIGTKTKDATSFNADLGGSAGNIAVALSRLGKDVSLVSVLSADSVGAFTKTRLEHYGVGTDYVRFADKGHERLARNSLAVAETRPDDAEVVIYRNGAADLLLCTEDVVSLDFKGASALIVTGTALSANPSREAVFAAASQANTDGCPVVFDVDYRRDAWQSVEDAACVGRKFTSMSDIVIGNDDEFDVLATGTNQTGLAYATELAGDVGLVLYKQGAVGCQAFHIGKQKHKDMPVTVSKYGIFNVSIFKPFGAGDSFMGAFLAALHTGVPLDDAIVRGSAAAAIVVSRPGCASAMPDKDTIDTFMAQTTVSAYGAT
ncbi:MAG: carbohydrate kinase [Candidatus Puniceispirillum sp.]|jgi:5-dehydro-2-deoxygluconokinase|uniref:PfkB family carbohydrate kinase n=1 Tax=Candidatus Puniceispirillum sp. TaxID=2026719 RepID=UPI001EC5323A|nr:carbohydrate kinase [Candidatus Puniceispirillum sp.]MBT6416630.1 carbohydrate kinase [Candidatus Puniceispirillum sp.]MBT6566342.1 carbohydrate kinase [Candidatus Puniceispirillum sp.]